MSEQWNDEYLAGQVQYLLERNAALEKQLEVVRRERDEADMHYDQAHHDGWVDCENHTSSYLRSRLAGLLREVLQLSEAVKAPVAVQCPVCAESYNVASVIQT